MSRRQVERRLTEVGRRIRELREELQVADEQLAHLADAADDARLRSLVSETPVSDREHREAARHADAMRNHRTSVADEQGWPLLTNMHGRTTNASAALPRVMGTH